MDNKEFAKHFQQWIDTFADDVNVVIQLVTDDNIKEELKKASVGALNYGLKQLDLIPDFYTPVGLIDDAMILRVFAKVSIDDILEIENEKLMKKLVKLANDDDIISKFVGPEVYRVLVNYVKALPDEKVRHRNAKIILTNPEVKKEFIDDLKNDLIGYRGATIVNPDEVCKDLRSFLKMKLVG